MADHKSFAVRFRRIAPWMSRHRYRPKLCERLPRLQYRSDDTGRHYR